ncbi:Receptor-like protein 12 [Morella rubra]|uniref:Receptor-like protein 12 n=1 Tax=Morella rubra TaxID=262757 RepID=A0A6A1VC03_9ROSI|nr:Receptor-like protein 12 [Morella rubra]
MGTYFNGFMFMRQVLFLTWFLLLLTITNSFSSLQLLCHEDESSALMQFKHRFVINKSVSSYPFAYPKVASWKNNSDCCSWDGVECSEDTGHVVSLDLSSSCLYGSINSNSSLFHLVHLRRLNLADNHFNYSQIPIRVTHLSRLEYLNLSLSKFSGQIPSELSQLAKLSSLDLSYNHEAYSKSLGTLVQNLTSIQKLLLSSVSIPSTIPESIANLSSLTHLVLFKCGLYGEFPVIIFQLPNLLILELGTDQDLVTGHLPAFNSSSPLKVLGLGATANDTLPQFETLGLGSCNLRMFPDFLRSQHKLQWLDLSGNGFQGLIPKWMYNASTDTLKVLMLSGNYLTGFEQSPAILPWSNLNVLLLSGNMLQGSLPILPPSIQSLEVSDNAFTEKFPPWVCNMTSLVELDLSNNRLSGTLHPCLGNFSRSLKVLSLQSNNFHGIIPKGWAKGGNLQVIDLSQNQLQGQLPRSLVHCSMLEFLHVGDNEIHDIFPFWLGTLAQLKILVLRSNGFHGVINDPETNDTFLKLRIIDLSHNDFSGNLPSRYFSQWNSMRAFDAKKLTYLLVGVDGDGWGGSFDYSFTITNKGKEQEYEKILDVLTVIDFSCNRFRGEIPEAVGNLTGLHLLNFSNNGLTGHIPSSLGNLKNLEAMDLAQNKLVGEIPPELVQLNFLAVFNVSNNSLTGPIPCGKQFDTFQISSFEHNPGLCGRPLSKTCGDSSLQRPSIFEENQGSKSLFEFDWKVVVIGYGCGLVVGIFIGQIMIPKEHDWFVRIFRKKQQTRGRVKGRK